MPSTTLARPPRRIAPPAIFLASLASMALATSALAAPPVEQSPAPNPPTLNSPALNSPESELPAAASPSRWVVQIHQPSLPPRSISARPAFATLEAEMAHWDADPEFDGWLATVRVFDAAGQPIPFSGNVSFELTPQRPSVDLATYVGLAERRLRWSATLATDALGCASFKLPLRREWARDGRGPHVHSPVLGSLQVRVAIATEGVFEAESIVTIRPFGPLDTIWQSGLVDTLWNGR